jgi:hypothetical protein
MKKRLNIVLPEATVRTIARLTKPGERSRFIDRAVRHYVATRSTEALKAQMERTAVRDRDLDREVAEEWLAVDQEIWQRLDQSEKHRKQTSRSVGRSSSQRSTRL